MFLLDSILEKNHFIVENKIEGCFVCIYIHFVCLFFYFCNDILLVINLDC